MKVSPAEYHTWAQQSINRIAETPITVNGLSHEVDKKYKAEVRKLQRIYLGHVTGVVDSTTQNFLIKNNHIDTLYMKWVRECLYKITGNTLVLRGGGHDKYLQDSIKQYQGTKTKANLTKDGWVGVQTEIVLALESGIRMPESPGRRPSPMPPEILTKHWLDNLEIDLLEWTLPVNLPFKHTANVDDRKYFKRFVARLAQGNYNYDYLDWHTVRDYCENADGNGKSRVPHVLPEQLQPVNALRYLRYLVATTVNPQHPHAYSHFIWACWKVFEDVESGLFRVIYEAKRQSVDVPKGRPKLLLEFTDKRVADPRSFLSLYPEWKSWNGYWNWK